MQVRLLMRVCVPPCMCVISKENSITYQHRDGDTRLGATIAPALAYRDLRHDEEGGVGVARKVVGGKALEDGQQGGGGVGPEHNPRAGAEHDGRHQPLGRVAAQRIRHKRPELRIPQWAGGVVVVGWFVGCCGWCYAAIGFRSTLVLPAITPQRQK